MLIGLDLDNTIIDYDAAFVSAARRAGMVETDFQGSKRDVRARLWDQPNGDAVWQVLQAQIYGPDIGEARLAKGYRDFALQATAAGAQLVIVSHKTRFAAAALDGPDLRACARSWMVDRGVIGSAPGQVQADRVIFSDSRDGKIDVIRRFACDAFVDDLTEVLLHPEFPITTTRLHYHPEAGDETLGCPGLVTCRSWRDVARFTLSA